MTGVQTCALPISDVAILNVALTLEHEAIAAYQIGAESGLLQSGVLAVAVRFQSHHKAHRDALAGTIAKLGGSAIAATSMDEYVKSAKLNVGAIKDQGGVLQLAQRLELGAVNAYLGVIPAFGDRELAKIAAGWPPMKSCTAPRSRRRWVACCPA